MRLTLTLLATLTSTIYGYDVNCLQRGRSNFVGSNSGCWLQWSGWSECMGTCGKGIKTANRKCRGPEGFALPGLTPGCSGSDVRRRPCSDSTIVAKMGDSCAYWSYWSEWSSCTLNTGDYCNKSTFFGKAARTRVCNDPEASLLGVAPRCAPDALTQVTNMEERPCSTAIPDACSGGLDHFVAGAISECNVPCGMGKREQTWTHKCANYPDTWVLPKCWYYKTYTACKQEDRPCCPDQWSEWAGVPNECNSYRVTRWRAKGYTCRPESESEMRDPTIPQTPCIFENDQVGWGPCMPMPAPWNDKVLSVCDNNGFSKRTCEHSCVKRGGCVPGDYNCKWLQEPWSWSQQNENCGLIRESEILITCDPTGCGAAKCQEKLTCPHPNERYNPSYRTVECPAHLVSQCQASKPSCALPSEVGLYPGMPRCPAVNYCGCGETHRTYRSSKCGIINEETVPCPAPTETCIWSEWRKSEALQRAIMARKCVCKNSLDHREHKFLMCQTQAETGAICSRVERESEGRIYINAEDRCLSLPKRTPCAPKKCLEPFESLTGPMFQVFRHDYCSEPMEQINEGVPQPCYPNLPQCCFWSAWTVDPCPSTIGLCPSQAPMRMRRRTNSCPDQFQEEVESSGMKCSVSCPAWRDFGDWSECNNILEDGTHCGGYRTRVRDYPCRQDVMDGICRPNTWGSRYNYNNGMDTIDIDFFTDKDTSNILHHSTFCHNLMLADNGRMVASMWSEWQLDNERPCDWNRQIRYVRTRTINDKCHPKAEPQVEVGYESRPSMPCIDQAPVLPEACQYSPDGCSANILYKCLAVDSCGESVTKSRAATGLECPIAPKLSVPSINPICTPIPNDMQQFASLCAGTTTERVRNLCTGEYSEREVSCKINEYWTDWSAFENVPVVSNWRKELSNFRDVSYYNIDYVSQCDVCGLDTLVSTRKLMCANSEIGADVVEYREVPCGSVAPTFTWSTWSECNICAQGNADKFCERTRTLISSKPNAANCPKPSHYRPEDYVSRIALPPCDRVRYDYSFICQHSTDQTANCGQAFVWTRQIITTIDNLNNQVKYSFTKDHPFYFTGARNGSSINMIENASEYQKVSNKVCNLACRVVPVTSDWSGCTYCNGGSEYKVTEYTCRHPYDSTYECRFPHGEVPKQPITEERNCAAPPAPATQSEWTGPACSMCQNTRKERRTCVGGQFANSTNIFGSYYRSAPQICCQERNNCCVKDPSSTLISTYIEEREAPCPAIARPPRCVTTVDPACECGCCQTTVTCYDPCTNIKISENPGDEQCRPELPPYIGAWSPCLYSTNLCKVPGVMVYEGFQNRTISNECYEGKIIPPRVETRIHESCRIAVEQLPPKEGPCVRPYNTDCTPPVKTITYETWCNKQRINVTTERVACPWVETPMWTTWSECTQECSRGIRTRRLITKCNPDATIETETEECGCQASVWTDWSEWDNEEDVCVACRPGQVVTSVRTCQHPQAVASTITRSSNWGYGYGYGRSSFANPCFAKCNLCQGESVRQRSFNPDDFLKCRGFETMTNNTCPHCPIPGQTVVNVRTYCGREIDRTETACERPVYPPKITYLTPCSVPCGMGTRKVKIEKVCEAPVITEEACQGEHGDIVELPITNSTWSICSAPCDGGIESRNISEKVCEYNHSIQLSVTTQTQSCNNFPCSYWGGWTEFGLCSTTCGKGVTQRYRQCHGGRPSPFGTVETACEGSSVDVQDCSQGNCCDFPWSGWTNCCQEEGVRKRLRWQGHSRFHSNECNNQANYKEIIEDCGDYQIDRPLNELQMCANMRPTSKFYSMGSTTIEYNYRYIDDGTYHTNNGYTFEILNGRWFRKTSFGGRQEVSVQQELSKYDNAYLYKVGGVWYKFNNGRLYQTVYTAPEPTVTTTQYTYGYVGSGSYTIGTDRYEIFINQDRPVWSRYNSDGSTETITIVDKYFGNQWYYQFNGLWYVLRNGAFEEITTLPWEPVQWTSGPTSTTYTIIDSAGSGLSTGVTQTYPDRPAITTTYTSSESGTVGRSSWNSVWPNNMWGN